MTTQKRHTRSSTGGTQKITEEEFKCDICGKPYKNKKTLLSHLNDCHDNKKKRAHSLRCIHSSCTYAFMSRQKYTEHISICTSGDSSSTTEGHDEDVNEDKDSDELEVQEVVETDVDTSANIPKVGQDEDEEDQSRMFKRLQEQLVSVTGIVNTAEFMLSFTEPIALTLKNGETENVLALPGGTKRLSQDGTVSFKPVKRRADKGSEIQDGELRSALAAHAFGGLVDESNYQLLDEDLCDRTFREDGKHIAKRLGGAIIQSGTSVLLALKVEVYGRTPSEDPHQQDVVFPALGTHVVESLLHDGATKILIGTQTWTALVTSAVILTSGAVVVGPNNTVFNPHPRSKVWILKDSRRNPTIERQTRSEFDSAISLGSYAGVFVSFQAHKFLPVTLKTLWDYLVSKKWSGIKLVAYVFYQLHHNRRLEKIEIESKIEEVKSIKNKTQSDPKILKDVKDLVLAFEECDYVAFPVPRNVSNCLRILAEHTTGAITSLNKDSVASEIEKHIRRVLNKMSSSPFDTAKLALNKY
ncbi:hypothetical protein BGZ65_004963 [Modicella reniformis]|uniref:C2H2-type domain-containing protein n=1 Tax=Modicella reniformis TaxID=1440133 RepID=A0A9P6M8Q3_9FUNG|nr:hypothetical protein BGZ65_004963 [Modicella reniformis]